MSNYVFCTTSGNESLGLVGLPFNPKGQRLYDINDDFSKKEILKGEFLDKISEI